MIAAPRFRIRSTTAGGGSDPNPGCMTASVRSSSTSGRRAPLPCSSSGAMRIAGRIIAEAGSPGMSQSAMPVPSPLTAGSLGARSFGKASAIVGALGFPQLEPARAARTGVRSELRDRRSAAPLPAADCVAARCLLCALPADSCLLLHRRRHRRRTRPPTPPRSTRRSRYPSREPTQQRSRSRAIAARTCPAASALPRVLRADQLLGLVDHAAQRKRSTKGDRCRRDQRNRHSRRNQLRHRRPRHRLRRRLRRRRST